RDLGASGGGAATHYAVDALRDGKPVMRVIAVDTSTKSLAVGEAGQQPVASQTRWLIDVLCFKGQRSAAQACTRDPGEEVVVVSNTPTYSYGPGTSDTETDGSTFEALLLKYQVSVVVSGRLGWNGLYYATAAGVHAP